jgi:phosphoglycerate dehydrogenase-like enzyme
MMSKKLVWIIDEEWQDYDEEKRLLHQELPEAEIRFSGYDYAADLEAFGCQADIILAQIYVPLPETVLGRLRCCKGIAVYGGGYDRVDVAAARRLGIGVTNVSGYCVEDIADYVLAAIFHKAKAIGSFTAALQAGRWGAQAVSSPCHRLSAATLLIAGCGRIGRYVGSKARVLGLRVLGYDPYVSAEQLAACGMEKVTLQEGLAQADFVSVHIKYGPATEGLIGAEEFASMKPTAILINTSRGRVLREDDLVAAVRSGRIAGAVLDVISEEPPVGQEAVLHTAGIMVTPHISYISQESYQELKRRTVENALMLLRGRTPADTVN